MDDAVSVKVRLTSAASSEAAAGVGAPPPADSLGVAELRARVRGCTGVLLAEFDRRQLQAITTTPAEYDALMSAVDGTLGAVTCSDTMCGMLRTDVMVAVATAGNILLALGIVGIVRGLFASNISAAMIGSGLLIQTVAWQAYMSGLAWIRRRFIARARRVQPALRSRAVTEHLLRRTVPAVAVLEIGTPQRAGCSSWVASQLFVNMYKRTDMSEKWSETTDARITDELYARHNFNTTMILVIGPGGYLIWLGTRWLLRKCCSSMCGRRASSEAEARPLVR